MSSEQIYIYPTDTVWGIGCDIYSEIGFLEIARIKKTSVMKPLTLMFTEVEQVMEIFTFPKSITKNWLEDYFLFESTLGVPTVWAAKKIPHWWHAHSDYISFRCLKMDALDKVFKKIGNPFFTTSLNIQGESPILTETAAREFASQFCPQAIISEGATRIMSGKSSTIIFLHNKSEKLGYEVKRVGEKTGEIIAYLDRLLLV